MEESRTIIRKMEDDISKAREDKERAETEHSRLEDHVKKLNARHDDISKKMLKER